MKVFRKILGILILLVVIIGGFTALYHFTSTNSWLLSLTMVSVVVIGLAIIISLIVFALHLLIED